MRLTYVAFATTVIGPQPIESSLEILRTSDERYGLILDSDMVCYAWKRPYDITWPTREQLDKRNVDIKTRVDSKSLTERSST